MGKSSYLRFNPENREIELEGTEQFIKTYFDKLQQMLPQEATALPVKKAKVKTKAKVVIPAPGKMVTVASKKATAKESQKISLIDKIVGLIQDSKTGMTTVELKDQTGMTQKQIWAITSRAAKLGKIKTTKRGVYVPG